MARGYELNWRETLLLNEVPHEFIWHVGAQWPQAAPVDEALQAELATVRQRNQELQDILDAMAGEPRPAEPPMDPEEDIPAPRVRRVLLDKLFHQGPPGGNRLVSDLSRRSLSIMLANHYQAEGRRPGLQATQRLGHLRAPHVTPAERQRLVLTAVLFAIYSGLSPTQGNFPWQSLLDSGDFSGYPQREVEALKNMFKRRQRDSAADDVYQDKMLECQGRILAGYLCRYVDDDNFDAAQFQNPAVWQDYFRLQYEERLPYNSWRSLYQRIEPGAESENRLRGYVREYLHFIEGPEQWIEVPVGEDWQSEESDGTVSEVSVGSALDLDDDEGSEASMSSASGVYLTSSSEDVDMSEDSGLDSVGSDSE